MFYKKKEVIDNSISNLEKRICDLENPYKFNIGDYVCSESYSFSENATITNYGTVVSQNHDYRDEHYELRGLIRFSTFAYNPTYKRFNRYLVFHEQENKTIEYNESEIKLKTKQK